MHQPRWGGLTKARREAAPAKMLTRRLDDCQALVQADGLAITGCIPAAL